MEDRSDSNFKFAKEWEIFIRTGNSQSLGVIYNNYFDLLFNYGRRMNFKDFIIEDAIQNVFLSLIKSQKRLKIVDNPASYIFCSFRNELFRLNSKQYTIPIDDICNKSFIDSQNSWVEETIRQESDSSLNAILKKCICNLTPQQKEILYMRYDAGMSYKDISGIVRISVESCRTSVYRAIKSLKQELTTIKKQMVHFTIPWNE